MLGVALETFEKLFAGGGSLFGTAVGPEDLNEQADDVRVVVAFLQSGAEHVDRVAVLLQVVGG